jgi:hypothetical protein
MQDDNDEIVLIPDLDEDGGADSDQRSKLHFVEHVPQCGVTAVYVASCTCSPKCKSSDTDTERSGKRSKGCSAHIRGK